MASRRSSIAAEPGADVKKETPGEHGGATIRELRWLVHSLPTAVPLTGNSRSHLQSRRHERNLLPRRSWRPPNHVAKWLPAVAAAGLLGTVIVAGVALGGGGDSNVQQTELADSAFVVDTGVTALTVPDSVPDVIGAVETSLPVDKTVLQRNLSKGLAGDDVKQVQLRLTDLGFVPGPADGIYGDQTVKAVWAYEKLVLKRPSNDPTGRVTPEMWDAMQEPFVIQPRRPNATPNHTEVYLPEQVLAIFHDDKPAMITHMSSGSNEQWCEEVTISPGEYGNREGTEPLVRGECGISNTPGGVFTVYREVEGHPRERARRNVESGLLQLRHRHPRCAQRAVAGSLARLHPHPVEHL